MNIILLSGGSGKRLWPLSNEIRSKQFIKMFRREDGTLESMVQRVYRQIKGSVGEDTRVTIATSRSQVSSIRNQLPHDVNVCVEPARRDTFPAVALSCMYLAEVLHVDPAEPVIVCPVDPCVDDEYFDCFPRLAELAASDRWNIALMGVKPTYPSEKYGYLVPEDPQAPVSNVTNYTEKPDLPGARALLAQGALWNCGVFAFRLEYMLGRAAELLPYTKYQALYDNYADCEKISFDYAVGEKERSEGVLVYDRKWKDIGSWNTLAEEMHEDVIGKGILDQTCRDSNIVNELDIPILGMGLEHVIIAASNDGILVADKHQSSYMKPLVEQLSPQVRYAEKSWGSFTILDVGAHALTIRIRLMPGHRLHYHAHERRSEVWTVTRGEGTVILDDERREVAPGAVIELPIGAKHTILAKTELEVIEVQLGDDIRVDDKIKYEDPFPEGPEAANA
ncbi:MAG: cupin domain-containing protein [Lachnospiraceae bacterium]|nr:cupin domain-containing protein [Lachnospiraceae bacterium]